LARERKKKRKVPQLRVLGPEKKKKNGGQKETGENLKRDHHGDGGIFFSFGFPGGVRERVPGGTQKPAPPKGKGNFFRGDTGEWGQKKRGPMAPVGQIFNPAGGRIPKARGGAVPNQRAGPPDCGPFGGGDQGDGDFAPPRDIVPGPGNEKPGGGKFKETSSGKNFPVVSPKKISANKNPKAPRKKKNPARGGAAFQAFGAFLCRGGRGLVGSGPNASRHWFFFCRLEFFPFFGNHPFPPSVF